MYCSSVVPRLSPKHSWCVAQDSEAKEDDDTQVHIFYNLHDPMSYYRCQIPELLGKLIRGCFHGCWAVLSSNHPRDVMWSLWNPFTSQIINLPPLIHNGSEENYYDITYNCCLSAPPDYPNSVLLLTKTKKPRGLVGQKVGNHGYPKRKKKKKPNIVYCWIGSDSYFRNEDTRMKLRWTERTFAKQLRSITGSDGSFYNLTCCNGKVYAYFAESDVNSHSLLLVEFDIVVNDRKYTKLKEVVITLLPVLEFQCPRIVDSFSISLLKGSCSELFMIVLDLEYEAWTSTSVSAVYVFRLDMNNRRWEEMEDLKETILSVALPIESSTFYSPATASSELGGYIHILADKGKIIYSYHVKDKTISLSSIPCLAGTNHVSAWAMLECTRLENDHVDSKQENDKDVDIIVRSVKGDEDESQLLNLPLHVVGMIMEFCVGLDYLRFRSTCKSCHLASPVIPWNNRKASKRLQKYSLPSPWLIVLDKHKGIITLTDPMFGDKYFIKTPQELICDLEIKGSKYGWLLILKSSGSLLFYNPFTSDIRKLPLLRGSEIFSFSAPPTSPDCMVVGIAYEHYYYYVHIHFVGGEPSWRRIPFDIDYGNYYFLSLTLYGRDLYALGDDIGLYMFEEVGGDCSWEPNVAKTPTSCCTSFPRSYLLSCDQHLLHVIVGKFGESVEVFKLKKSKEWVKIDSLGKHMIFICGTSSFCVDAKKPHMENKIYFPRLPADNENMNDILFYSLETCWYHTFNNKNFQESFWDFFGTKHPLAPHAWIEPTWS
ncbi:PAZ domain-containing protein [Tanacetum coccineum]|uniref:PAZ domain-containing protein n=1 Tax=Tanacetum coccineum TaxID=301880 RepID=A0ABQ5C383_9ASTR